MRFTAAQVDAFFRASHDANPLHRDPVYALRSQFGRPVVYGMAAVLYVLGRWSAGRPFQLTSLRADFRKPLFEDEDYECRIEETRNGVRCRLGKGSIDYTLILFSTTTPNAAVANAATPPGFVPRAAASPTPLTAGGTRRFTAGDLAPLESQFGVGVNLLPGSQLATLLWASYHVGMEMPGSQALFSELRIEFAPDAAADASIELDLDTAVRDERFQRYSLTARGRGIKSLRIAAFERPRPADFPLAGIEPFADGERSLQGKVVFVSGAARGFGAVMARVCALAGARIAINHRGHPAAAVALCDELRSAGHEALAFGGDLDRATSAESMAQAIGAAFGRVDVIINNAAPAIRELQFTEQGNDELLAFVQSNLAITVNTARTLLPLMRDGGQFIHISTRYLAEPVRGFSHYLAAKGAQEGLLRALAEEYPGIEFLLARLPRILTDQTNLPFSIKPPADPRDVARALVRAAASRGEARVRVLDLP